MSLTHDLNGKSYRIRVPALNLNSLNYQMNYSSEVTLPKMNPLEIHILQTHDQLLNLRERNHNSIFFLVR